MRVSDNASDTWALAPIGTTDLALDHCKLADGSTVDVLYAESNGPDGSAAPRVPLCWRLCDPESKYDHHARGDWTTERIADVAKLAKPIACCDWQLINVPGRAADYTTNARSCSYHFPDGELRRELEAIERAERQAHRESRQERRAGMMRS